MTNQNNGSNLMFGFGILMSLIATVAAVYTSQVDTPPNRAANERLGLLNEAALTQLASKKEETKQMKIQAQAGALHSGTSSQVGAPGARAAFPLAGKGEFFLAPGRDYLITGDGESVTASIGYHVAPHSSEGAYKISGCDQVAWTQSWSQDPSPIDPAVLMQQCVGTGQKVPYLEVIPRGTVRFNFT